MKNPTLSVLAAATVVGLSVASITPVNAQSALLNGGTQTQTSQSAAHPTFAHFREPQLMTALYHGDFRSSGKSKVETMHYLMKIISTFGEPQVWYRIGQHADVALDPELAPVARGLFMTEPALMQPMGEAALGGIFKAFINMGQERKRQTSSGEFNPFKEIAEFNKGMISSTSPFARVAVNAGHDAKNLMLLAQEDPDAFMRTYDNIRTFVYTY